MDKHDKEIEAIKKEKSESGRFRQYLRNFMASAHRHMSAGAESIHKIITSSHKDQWRRREKKK